MTLLRIPLIHLLASTFFVQAKVPDLNQYVLQAVKSMPEGCGYEASQRAVDRLATSVSVKDGRIHHNLNASKASFCSGATYLVFLRVIDRLQKNKTIQLSDKQLARFVDIDVDDGEEIFGRWNANGPGTAKLFAELGCGVNFTPYEHARPGDFMKVWWTTAIGGKERGHLVVYLGHTKTNVKFWSSNKPGGYGIKTVPRSRIKHTLFSRLTRYDRFTKSLSLSKKNQFLADMLSKEFSWAQIVKQCKVRTTP